MLYINSMHYFFQNRTAQLFNHYKCALTSCKTIIWVSYVQTTTKKEVHEWWTEFLVESNTRNYLKTQLLWWACLYLWITVFIFIFLSDASMTLNLKTYLKGLFKIFSRIDGIHNSVIILMFIVCAFLGKEWEIYLKTRLNNDKIVCIHMYVRKMCYC